MRAAAKRLVLAAALAGLVPWPAAAEPVARSDPSFPSLNRLSPGGMGRSTADPPPQQYVPQTPYVCDVYGRCWVQQQYYLVQPPPGYGYYRFPNGRYSLGRN
jgi:hypothetical protein